MFSPTSNDQPAFPRSVTPPAHPPTPPQRPHVLLIDPDNDVRATLRDLLEGDGCAVLATATVAAANRELRTHRPTVVVTELVLAGQESTGRLFLRELRDYDPLLPVVICTGLPWTRQRAQQVGQVAAADVTWLPKTYPDQAVLAMVRAAHLRYVETVYPQGGAGTGLAGAYG